MIQIISDLAKNENCFVIFSDHVGRAARRRSTVARLKSDYGA